MKRIRIYLMATLACSLLIMSTIALALTNEERLQLLQDRFLKGEISEKAYYEIKAQLEKKLGKTGVESKPSEVKPSQAVEGNLIKNGNFEEDKDGDGIPDNWEKWGSRVTYLMDDEEKHSGNYSGKLTSVRKIANEGYKQTVIVQPGQKYEFTVWAKGGGDLQYFQGDSGPIVSFSGGGGFIEKRKAFNVPTWLKLSKVVTGPKEGKIRISMYLYQCSGTVWFDDAVLKPIE